MSTTGAPAPSQRIPSGLEPYLTSGYSEMGNSDLPFGFSRSQRTISPAVGASPSTREQHNFVAACAGDPGDFQFTGVTTTDGEAHGDLCRIHAL